MKDPSSSPDSTNAEAAAAGPLDLPLGTDKSPSQEQVGPLKIIPEPNGPLIIETTVEVVTETGQTEMRTKKAALCRCGHSSKMPLCDGTHQRVGFHVK